MLQFADQRVVLADDPKAKLLQLFDHYIERNFVTKEYQERLLENNVRKLLFNAKVGARYQRQKVGTEDFAVNFPFVDIIEGKAERVIKPLYLAQGDSTKILTHGGQWVDKIRRLRKRNALLPKVLFPVTQPAANSKPYYAFQEIKQDLLSENVQVIAADNEAEILKFATEIS